MLNNAYNWKRFWCPRDGNINLLDGGYLYDPESEWGNAYNSDVLPFESVANFPCLVLLGEPGIGKSYAMEFEKNLIEKKINTSNEDILFINLRKYSTDSYLCQDIFGHPQFKSWLKGSHHLHLFLDSLDECLLRIDSLAALLSDELKKYPVDRLFLRIACRTADWPNSLENNLKTLWEENNVGIYELAPLRRKDVIEATKANQIEADLFLNEIDRMQAVPLAIKPITLNFLINTFFNEGQLPSNRTDLYLKGCRLLCEETNENRRDSKLKENLSIDHRMIIAARIAAITMFSNKYAIWTGTDSDTPPEDVFVQSLCRGSEPLNDQQVEVTETAIKETLGTGLFSSRGTSRMGWAHQSYAEYLAAWYIKKHNISQNQMMALLTHPGDIEGKLVPQLHETAAWLANMDSELFDRIMETDPDVLLKSDIATTDNNKRRALVDILLKLYDQERLLDNDWGQHKYYAKLIHPGLADQLKPYIMDSSKGFVVRRVAIDIAEACDLKELQDELVEITLNQSESLHIRTQAACAISRVGDDEAKQKLKPLIGGELGDDAEDELKGCALRALWPKYITAEELFSLLTPFKSDRLYGAYKAFICHNLMEGLEPNDLPIALSWVEKQQEKHVLQYTFQELMDDIMTQAWQYLESPGVLEAYAMAILSRLKSHDTIVGNHNQRWDSTLFDNEEKRYKLVLAITPLIINSEHVTYYLLWSTPPLLLEKDFFWVLDNLKTTKNEAERKVWAKIIIRLFNINDVEKINAILITCNKLPILTSCFENMINPVKLNSPEAEEMKKKYLEEKKIFERGIRKPPLLDPPPEERVAKFLDECESGNLSSWWCLTMEMTLNSNSTHYGKIFESNLSNLPGWQAADTISKRKIMNIAKEYVLKWTPTPDEWLGKNIFHHPDFSGYKALRLLQILTPSFIVDLSSDVWQKWAPVILAYPITNGDGSEKPHNELVKLAYKHSSKQIIDTLMILIDKENREHDHLSIIYKIIDCWDEQLEKSILGKIKDKNLKPLCIKDLLRPLLEHNVVEAKQFAEFLISSYLKNKHNAEIESKAITATQALLHYTEDADWAFLWPIFQNNIEFSKKVFLGVGYNSIDFGQKLNEEQLADLYIWFAIQFPHAKDSKNKEASWVTPRDSVGNLRDSILRYLQNKGTNQACIAIQKIMIKLPKLDWLKWTLHEARNVTRRSTWNPLSPGEILKLTANHQLRLVQNGDQLLGIIMESLERLRVKLHGETPAVNFLWNEVKNSKGQTLYRPKDEKDFSDFVKIHLVDDIKNKGIIINREVEIRRGKGAAGEQTDIHVDAITQDVSGKGYDCITVIIEVKGCWNPGLQNAMETQLLDRYLKNNQCDHGLYLVGWFNCDQWDNDDYRKGDSPKTNLDDTQKKFEEQAIELSKQGKTLVSYVLNTALH